MKLWKKNYDLNKEIEKFTVGNDHILDQKLVVFDCIASIAHVNMLKKKGIVSDEEGSTLVKGLNEIIALNQKGEFEINPEDEDCHTAIENYLTDKFSEVGMKVHTARSRNDQILTALRLFEKSELLNIMELLTEFKNTLSKKIEGSGSIRMPGYTHMQKAMPMTVKDWLGCFSDSADDNLKLLDTVLQLIDQSPLGTAAGFGVPVLDIDRNMTAEEMGFSKVQENPVYAQMSRGKFESTIIHSLTQIMFDLNKLSTDLILFSMKEFGYVSLPDEFCTGSSIMPQKKNPDVLELIRAKYHVVVAEEFKVKCIIGHLMSGYNRDVQLTKEPLFTSLDTTKECLHMMTMVIDGLEINKEACEKALTEELFATEEVYQLVKEGVPFREAYRRVSGKYQ